MGGINRGHCDNGAPNNIFEITSYFPFVSNMHVSCHYTYHYVNKNLPIIAIKNYHPISLTNSGSEEVSISSILYKDMHPNHQYKHIFLSYDFLR